MRRALPCLLTQTTKRARATLSARQNRPGSFNSEPWQVTLKGMPANWAASMAVLDPLLPK